MKEMRILDMNHPDFVEQLRDAIGVGPGEAIEVVTPQFERSKGEPPPASVPSDWGALRSMSRQALKEVGLRAWDEPGADGTLLMLLPGEWHASIPDGFDLECINGRAYRAGRDRIDDDVRFGCLAYGIRVWA